MILLYTQMYVHTCTCLADLVLWVNAYGLYTQSCTNRGMCHGLLPLITSIKGVGMAMPCTYVCMYMYVAKEQGTTLHLQVQKVVISTCTLDTDSDT